MTLPSGIQFKTPINCILLHEFPLIYKILAFTTFFPSHFHKKIKQFQKDFWSHLSGKSAACPTAWLWWSDRMHCIYFEISRQDLVY